MAQLDNAADSDSEERGFKSLRAGQKKKPVIPYVSRDCRLFSTDEGVNDFLNWLKEDSGYSKAEKKSVLQRIIEFFDRIVEAVKQTIKDGDLSQTAKSHLLLREYGTTKRWKTTRSIRFKVFIR